MIISGTVKDVYGVPLTGVNVYPLRNGQSYGVGGITDYDGNFLIESDQIISGQLVRLSYVGFKPQEFTAGQLKDKSITMEESAESLDEIVLIGTKTKPKKNNKILEYTILAVGIGSLSFVTYNLIKQNG